MTLYWGSGLDDVLPEALMVGDGQYYLYGDSAYMVRPWLQAAFKGVMTPEPEDCNATMKVPRTSVEWAFKDVKQVCARLDFPRKLRIQLSPVGLLYRTKALVWNLRCCLYGDATSTFFKCSPPTLSSYVGLDAAGALGGSVAAGSAGFGDDGVEDAGGGGAADVGGPANS